MLKDIAVIGMAVMGKNLALNIADHGYDVVIYNRTTSVMSSILKDNPHPHLFGAETLEDLVKALKTPRKLILMVKAGSAVDALLDTLAPLLDQGDIVVDAGNSYFQDSIRREAAYKAKGLKFVGMGVSGGEEGARRGPAIMPGGDPEAHAQLKPILEAISAVAEGEACTTYIGTDGSGHYVKMVHNGIEYGDMQLIAEAYDVLKQLGHFTNTQLSSIFGQWNEGELNSYLIEITRDIFATKDDLSEADLIDKIKDTAGQKGTGIWTSKESMDLGINSSVITQAVYARFISADRGARVIAEQKLPAGIITHAIDPETLVERVRQALYLGKVISYAQGFVLLKTAVKQYRWALDFKAIAKIFRGGCIIRAQFLNRIADAYDRNPDLDNLLLEPYFLNVAQNAITSLREVVALAAYNGIPVPVLSSALSYYDAYRSSHLSTNLIQAQRDYFGAHTFERLDIAGNYHYDHWGKERE